MKYEVSKKTVDSMGRNEWHLIRQTNKRSEAISFALLQSKRCLETDVRGIDEDGDICFHSFYKKGKLQIQTV